MEGALWRILVEEVKRPEKIDLLCQLLTLRSQQNWDGFVWDGGTT